MTLALAGRHVHDARVIETSQVDVFIGIDVGKTEHWATALSRCTERGGWLKDCDPGV